MPKDADEVTGDADMDYSIQELRNNLFRVAKEMRSVCQTAANLKLWTTSRGDETVDATKIKAAHHPLIVLLIEQARQVDHWSELDRLAKSSVIDDEGITVDALDQRIKISTGKMKTLEAMRDSCLKIQDAGSKAMSQANDLIAKLQSMAQAYQIHRERLGKDLDFADTAELEKIAGPDSPAVSAGPRRLESFLSNP